MPIELKMPALSPTMEEGTLAKWLVKVGDTVKSGDLLAEIETDKATMEFEAVDEGVIAEIVVAEETDGVKVGAVIARMSGEEGAAAPAPASPPAPPAAAGTTGPDERGYGANPVEDAEVAKVEAAAKALPAPAAPPSAPTLAPAGAGARVVASPLARRIAEQTGVDLATITGSGPNGRIVKADVEAAEAGLQHAQPERVESVVAPQAIRAEPVEAPLATAPKPTFIADIPHEAIKLSNIRKTIAQRLTDSKQTIPHIYLTLDVRLDALLKLRGELNAALAARDIKLSVNDLLVKALALALIEVPVCNVSYQGDTLISYSRADISVAVSTPTGLITPIVVGADTKSLSAISVEVKDLAARARDGKLKPEEYQGGTASISNMGMYGITQFDAVINPPQAMIMAIGAGERRPVVDGDALGITTVMSATGSFDHRAIDGSDGAALMKGFKRIVENSLELVA